MLFLNIIEKFFYKKQIYLMIGTSEKIKKDLKKNLKKLLRY